MSGREERRRRRRIIRDHHSSKEKQEEEIRMRCNQNEMPFHGVVVRSRHAEREMANHAS
jgi:hypothetical protein